ncbi:MAG: hypothetical protein ABIH99_00510 [Candidatus Micrarchaeota archaeon]
MTVANSQLLQKPGVLPKLPRKPASVPYREAHPFLNKFWEQTGLAIHNYLRFPLDSKPPFVRSFACNVAILFCVITIPNYTLSSAVRKNILECFNTSRGAQKKLILNLDKKRCPISREELSASFEPNTKVFKIEVNERTFNLLSNEKTLLSLSSSIKESRLPAATKFTTLNAALKQADKAEEFSTCPDALFGKFYSAGANYLAYIMSWLLYLGLAALQLFSLYKLDYCLNKKEDKNETD